MEDTLIEIKNNLQENNNKGDEAKNQISDLDHKEAKNNHSEQEEKRIKKNEDSISSLGDNFKGVQHSYHRHASGGEKEQEIGNLFLKN